MILVTGATGNIGRLVVDELLAAGATGIRALTNKPEKAALPPEVEVVRGYLGRVETLRGVFDGVEKMYLAPLEETVREVTALAAKAGVRHIVDVSGPKDSWWAPVATAVEESGVAWTHLAPGEFMDNMLMWAEQIRTTGQVRDGYPDAANAPIDLGDIAAVAATALLSEGHDEAVAALEPAMGEFARWYVDGMRDLAEHPQQANRNVEEITGRPATTFAQWAAKKVGEFR